MRPRHRSGLPYLAAGCVALAAGCGRDAGLAPPPAVSMAVGPHGGTVVALPERAGLAEVVVEPAHPAPRARRSASPPPVVLAVYFFGADMSGPPAEAPSRVAATVETPVAAGPTPVALEHRPSPEPVLRYASAPGDFAYDELRGTLAVTQGGRTVALPFAQR